ncbi:MAG: PhzF family phenazine biosynthesis protein [Verrucomicrobia bacterium]|nr:PhzF family phenazine biosynthesis protein [Verrucomicrobiota bacterium]
MRLFKVHQVDAFTNVLFGGNPTTAVLDAEQLSEEEIRQLAQELGPLETAFVFPSEVAEFRLRYFTRKGIELPFCGHSTVGALRAIEWERRLSAENQERYAFQIETQAGIFPVGIDLTRPEGIIFTLRIPGAQLESCLVPLDELLKVIDVLPTQVDGERPLLIDRTSKCLYLTASSLESLGALSVDLPAFSRFCLEQGIMSLCVLTPRTFHPHYHVHARVFAPTIGIEEDPFSGSIQAGLAAYLRQEKMIPLTQKRIVSEQGHFLGRPGHVEIEVIEGTPFLVQLYAEAVHVFETLIELV